MAVLDNGQLVLAYLSFDTLCQQYLRDALHDVAQSEVPVCSQAAACMVCRAAAAQYILP